MTNTKKPKLYQRPVAGKLASRHDVSLSTNESTFQLLNLGFGEVDFK